MAGVDAGGRVEPDKVESALGAWGSLASALRKREQQKPAPRVCWDDHVDGTD